MRRLLAIITVTTNSDDVLAGNGGVSLREAITAIDAGNDLGDSDITGQNPGAFGTDDTINFNIPGAGVHTIVVNPISPGSPFHVLPHLTKPMTIDGYSQPGSSTNTLTGANNAHLLIAVDGSGSDTAGVEIEQTAADTLIRGLVFNNFDTGVAINIDRASNTRIAGNYFGTDATGMTAIPNGGAVDVFAAPGVVIGGLTPADANLISGNKRSGISIGNDGNGLQTIEGNLIGLNAAGTAALPNGTGIQLQGGFTVVGGTTAAARNIISGNGIGVLVSRDDLGSSVQGNYIGTDASGTTAIGNTVGISVDLLQTNGTIGGTIAGAGNLISGNGTGIKVLNSSGLAIQGNLIGTDFTSAHALGNTGAGISVETDSAFFQGIHDTRIGGSTPAAGNTIAYNGGPGIQLFIPGSDPTVLNDHNAIRLNRIYNNGGLGIDLGDKNGADGVTPNDPGDADAGPNDLQNAPILVSAINDAGQTTVQGLLKSAAYSDYLIDLYASDTQAPDGTAYAKRYLGTVLASTDFTGTAHFSASYAALADGQFITATATTTDVAPAGDTSEFAAPVQVTSVTPPPPPAPPTVTIAGVSHNEGDTGNTPFIFTLTRTGDTTLATTVAYSFLAGGTAIGGTDYNNATGQITFAAGETSKPLTINVFGDKTVESNETFTVVLSGVANATVVPNAGDRAVGTILNDDVAPPATGSVSIVTDPCDSTKKAVKIVGTDNKDTITVTRSGTSQGSVVVKINGTNKGTFSFTGSILVYGNGNNDLITIDSAITRTAFVWGGDGNDTVTGSGGADFLLGGNGNDNLSGGAGRDILFGGDGADKLNGGSDDDILVAGGTSYETNSAALCKLLDEWKRTDKNYGQRVSDIRNGGGKNGTVKLNASTVFSSSALIDTVTGGTGNDLFYVSMAPGDIITDKASFETVVIA